MLKKMLKHIGLGLVVYPIGFLYAILDCKSINKAWWLALIFDLIAITLTFFLDYFEEKKKKKQSKK